MSRVAKRRTFTVLGAVLLVALTYLAVPVHAGVETSEVPEVLCSKSTRDGVILAPCAEPSFLANFVAPRTILGAQTNFRDPIY